MVKAIGIGIILIAVALAVIVTVLYIETREAFQASKSIHKFVTEGRKQLEEEQKRWE